MTFVVVDIPHIAVPLLYTPRGHVPDGDYFGNVLPAKFFHQNIVNSSVSPVGIESGAEFCPGV